MLTSAGVLSRGDSNLLKHDPAPWRSCGFFLLIQFFGKGEDPGVCISIHKQAAGFTLPWKTKLRYRCEKQDLVLNNSTYRQIFFSLNML